MNISNSKYGHPFLSDAELLEQTHGWGIYAQEDDPERRPYLYHPHLEEGFFEEVIESPELDTALILRNSNNYNCDGGICAYRIAQDVHIYRNKVDPEYVNTITADVVFKKEEIVFLEHPMRIVMRSFDNKIIVYEVLKNNILSFDVSKIFKGRIHSMNVTKANQMYLEIALFEHEESWYGQVIPEPVGYGSPGAMSALEIDLHHKKIKIK